MERLRRGRRAWRLLAWATGTVVATLILATVGANLFVRRAARPFLTVAISEVSAPLAIVPGASVHRDGTPSPQLEDRLAAALELARSGRVDRILVSGARDGAYDEAGPMRRWLTQRGLPAARIIEDHAGFRTLDTVERAARLYGVRRAVICTQAFHVSRAVFLARRAGIDAVGLAVDGGGEGGGPRRSGAVTLRESLANLMAVIDTFVLRRQPRDPHQDAGGPRHAGDVREVRSSHDDSRDGGSET